MLRLEMVSLFTCYAKKLWEQSPISPFFCFVFFDWLFVVVIVVVVVVVFFSTCTLTNIP